MTNYKKRLVIGTRSSGLALAQTRIFIDKLLHSYPDMSPESIEIRQIKTSGDQNQTDRLDQMGGKGLFAKEIEMKIKNGEIDIGIHSMKDMPANDTKDLSIGCWLKRGNHRDALVSNSHKSLSDFHSLSVIGTSSIRRRSQLINLRRDISIKALRGNVDTRIQKLNNKEYDAIVLSIAGLKRLSLDHLVSYEFSVDEILPASCQGAIGIQLRSDNEGLKSFLAPINHNRTEFLCQLERDVLREIKANCNSPIGLYASEIEDKVILQCEIFDHQGQKIYKNKFHSHKNLADDLGKKMGDDILSNIGQEKINQLDNLENDFDYSP